MCTVRLNVNGRDFPVNYMILLAVVSVLSDKPQYVELAQALLALNLPPITEKLVTRVKLSADDIDAIWRNSDTYQKRSLAKVSAFWRNLTDVQAEEIMWLNDREILKSLAINAHELYTDPEEDRDKRLSGKMADALIDFIAHHQDREVQQALADNPKVPAKFKLSLAEMTKKDMDVRWYNVENLKDEDLEVLPAYSPEFLGVVVSSIEQIKDANVRQKAINILCNHRDPYVRLKLAENKRAPQAVMYRLANDPDADVAYAARKHQMEEK